MPEHNATMHNISDGEMPEVLPGWQIHGISVICPVCDWSFYTIGDGEGHKDICPYCFHGELSPLELDSNDAFLQYNPELVIRPSVSAMNIASEIETFAEKIPYPPTDLNPVALQQRLRLFYLPVWLVDCEVAAMWDAETGYDYEVVSHQERYSEGRWLTQEVKETRIRWEPRIGRLKRKYENIAVPALDIHSEIWGKLGQYSKDQAQAYTPDKVQNTLVRLPDQKPESAWSRVKPLLYTHASSEVRAAAEAEHIRNFRWAPNYHDKNWTMLLTPVYSTYYIDDSGLSQPVLIHAESGKVDGVRRSSMKRAQRLTLIIALIALAGFLLSLLVGAISVVVPPLLIIGILGGLISAGAGFGAFIPIIRSWRFNLRHKDQKRSVHTHQT